MSTPSSTQQQQQLKPKNIYVETYSDNIDKSALLGELLVNIGAIYRKKLCKTLDYIIFKDGKLKTMKYAVDNDIPLVNPLWLHDQLNNKFQGDNNYLIKRTFTELHLEINNKKRTKDKETLFDMEFKQKQHRKRRITMKDKCSVDDNNNMSILDVFSKESKDSECKCKCKCNSNNISRKKEVGVGKESKEDNCSYDEECGSSKWKNGRSKRRSEGWWNCKWGGGRSSKGEMIKEGNRKLNAVSYGLNENQIEFLNEVGIRRLITYKGEYDDYIKENSNSNRNDNKDDSDDDSSSDSSESDLDINSSDTMSYVTSHSKSNNKSITTNKNDNINNHLMDDIDVIFLQNNFDKYNWIILSFFISNKIIVNISYFISYTADLDDTTVVHSDNNNTPTQTLTPKQLEPLCFKTPFPPSLKSKTSTSSPLKYTFILSTTIPPHEHSLLKQIITLYLSQPLLDITNPFTLIPPHTYIISYIPLLTSQPTLSVKYIYDCYYSAKLIELNDTTKCKYTL